MNKGNYSIQSPIWYKQLIGKEEKNISSQRRKAVNLPTFSDDNFRRRVWEINQNIDAACKFVDGFWCVSVFHLRNTENLSLPKVNNTEFCPKFHVNSCCHSKYARGREQLLQLNKSNIIGLRTYAKAAKENHATFLANRTQKMNIDNKDNKDDAGKLRGKEAP